MMDTATIKPPVVEVDNLTTTKPVLKNRPDKPIIISSSSNNNSNNNDDDDDNDNNNDDDRPASVTTATVDVNDFRYPETFRERLYRILHSHRFHMAVVILVIIDCLLVIIELLAEMHILELTEGHSTHERQHSPLVHILHNISISILSAFVIEIFAKVYAFGFVDFLRHKLEVFDAFVVVVSLVLDVGFYNPDSAASVGSGLIIVLRLWRVARIINGIVLTVKKQAEHKLEREARLREGLLQELLMQRDYCHALEEDNRYLRKLLKANGIESPPPVESVAKVSN